MAVALNVSITFMKAATTGTLWAEAREISKNFKVGTYTVEVKDDAGRFGGAISGTGVSQKRQAADLIWLFSERGCASISSARIIRCASKKRVGPGRIRFTLGG